MVVALGLHRCLVDCGWVNCGERPAGGAVRSLGAGSRHVGQIQPERRQGYGCSVVESWWEVCTAAFAVNGMRGGGSCSDINLRDLEDAVVAPEGGVTSKSKPSASALKNSYSRNTAKSASSPAKGAEDDEPPRLDLDITSDFKVDDDGDEIESIDPDAPDAYAGCEYSEVKVKRRVRQDRPPREEPVQLWDCLVTAEDGTVVDCESSTSGGVAASPYMIGGYVTLYLPSHGVAIQLARNSPGAFRFRCSLNSSVFQSTSQGHWSKIESEGLDGFEYPSAVGVLEQEASKRTRPLASSVPWQREGGLEKMRAGKWSVERVWPGSNVCILNLDTGDLQIWLTPRGFYFFGGSAEGRAPTGLLSDSCFEVIAPDPPASGGGGGGGGLRKVRMKIPEG